MADEQVAPPPVPESGRKKLKILLIAAVLLAGAGGALFYLTRPQPAHASPEETRAPKAVLHLDEFVVNLADENDRAFLRIGIQLGLAHELRKGGESKTLELVPPIRDAILGALTQHKADDLLTTQGKAALKQAIINAVNQRLPELGVQDVYFTEFLVQR
ncbi:MAG: flagellar basal body-associated FliL family protein [Acidobacteriia bacterium]|nr:flagellar basal body-associated FliL family protein [Terriglobia bacterium]